MTKQEILKKIMFDIHGNIIAARQTAAFLSKKYNDIYNDNKYRIEDIDITNKNNCFKLFNAGTLKYKWINNKHD